LLADTQTTVTMLSSRSASCVRGKFFKTLSKWKKRWKM